MNPGPNPSGLCQCGCRLPTSFATKTNRSLGLVKGETRPAVELRKLSGLRAMVERAAMGERAP